VGGGSIGDTLASGGTGVVRPGHGHGGTASLCPWNCPRGKVTTRRGTLALPIGHWAVSIMGAGYNGVCPWGDLWPWGVPLLFCMGINGTWREVSERVGLGPGECSAGVTWRGSASPGETVWGGLCVC